MCYLLNRVKTTEWIGMKFVTGIVYSFAGSKLVYHTIKKDWNNTYNTFLSHGTRAKLVSNNDTSRKDKDVYIKLLLIKKTNNLKCRSRIINLKVRIQTEFQEIVIKLTIKEVINKS